MSQIKSSSFAGSENSFLGIITSVAPFDILEYMSFTDTSKSNGAWFAIMSLLLMLNCFVNIFIKSITDLWLTNTPFGVP